MGQRVGVPITPGVLEWAIQEGGYNQGSFAERIGVEPDTLDRWMAGSARPTKGEFTTIVDTLRRPSAIFFLPEAPDSTVPPELRSEPADGRPLGPDELRRIRRGIRLQRVLSEWLRETSEPIDFPHVEFGADPDKTGQTLRRGLGVSVDEQLFWGSARMALQTWREVLAQLRVQVLQLQLGENGVRGFSSWDDYLPVVGINTAYNLQARVFSIFHELAHLLARTQSACTDVNRRDSSEIERWCEEVASAALMPANDVTAIAATFPEAGTFELVKNVAGAFSVSLRAAALRMGDLQLVDDPRGVYRMIDRSAGGWDRKKGGGRSKEPRTRVVSRISEVGGSIVSIFDDALTSGYFHEQDISDYIQLEPREFEEAKSRLELTT